MDADGVSLWAQFNKPPIDLTSKNVARSLIEQHVGGLPVSDSLQQAADKCMALFEKEEQLEVHVFVLLLIVEFLIAYVLIRQAGERWEMGQMTMGL